MLNFGNCIFGWTPYLGRKCRFAVLYAQANEIPIITSDLLKFYRVEHNKTVKRISFELGENDVKRCEFSSTLSTNHENAEKFLNQLKKDNPKIKDLFSYYVFDTNGLDIPLVPGIEDLKSNTAIEQVKTAGNDFITYLIIGGIGYLGFKEWKKKGKK